MVVGALSPDGCSGPPRCGQYASATQTDPLALRHATMRRLIHRLSNSYPGLRSSDRLTAYQPFGYGGKVQREAVLSALVFSS